jgi:hypothetical protein
MVTTLSNETLTESRLHASMRIVKAIRSRLASKPAGGLRRSGSTLAEKEPLQIRIPTDIKRRFKAAAALRGLEPNELFVEVWEQYEREHP